MEKSGDMYISKIDMLQQQLSENLQNVRLYKLQLLVCLISLLDICLYVESMVVLKPSFATFVYRMSHKYNLALAIKSSGFPVSKKPEAAF